MMRIKEWIKEWIKTERALWLAIVVVAIAILGLILLVESTNNTDTKINTSKLMDQFETEMTSMVHPVKVIAKALPDEKRRYGGVILQDAEGRTYIFSTQYVVGFALTETYEVGDIIEQNEGN